ncbi:MaoC family dehydratase N-terminal domain-containing protein [Pseudonocardia halophobica]|uniref:Acyl dehydratase n=1 Tax=Pseudonocardia halophobica TaxID=29401 RepID=A0A9W6L0I8_9PSEU|nr:MaoC family dehydratase N-terminal domain-containing protein [Pseudonocardia halophobica]GLL10560.1 acyl dehydratase [Pseudonocardia halophobica]
MSDGLLQGSITDEAIELMRERIGYPNPTMRNGVVTWPWNETASTDSIRQFAHGYGDLNPLYTDRHYGADTRWGGMVAPPGYEWTMGIDHSPTVPDELAARTRFALRGVHLFNAGHEGWFYKPIRPGDTLTRSTVLADVREKESTFAGRSVIATNENTWWDQEGRVVARRRPWYIHAERRKVDSTGRKSRPAEQRASYTPEQIQEIDDAYDAELIRGADTLFYEDAEVGAPGPRMVKGPMLITDLMNFFMGAGWYGYGFPALRLGRENRRRLRGFYSKDDFGAWDAIMRIHWDDGGAQRIGVPAAYDIGPLRWTWLVHYCTNFSGDDGWVYRVRGEFRRFNYVGDTTWLTSTITDKRIDPTLGPLVELALSGTNQRGDQNIRGDATVLLASRALGPVRLPEPV